MKLPAWHLGYVLAWVCVCWISTANAEDGASPTFELKWEDPRVVYEGHISFSNSLTPPTDQAHWQPIELPDIWSLDNRGGVDRAWYRFTVSPPSEAVSWGVYLWRYSMNARIFFNQDMLVDGGSFETPVTRNLHRPLLAQIPASAWQAGENHVYVHLRAFPGYGHLLPIGIGPLAAFVEPYQERHFWQVDLSRYLFVLTLLIAMIALALWAVDRRNSAFGYFAAACLCWCLYSLNPFVGDLPFANIYWLRLLHGSIELFLVFLVMFVHRQLGVRRRWVEAVILGYALAANGYYWTLSIDQISRSANYFHLGTNIVGLYLAIFSLRRFFKTRNPEALLHCAMLFVLLGVSLHDLMLLSGRADDLWINNFLMFNLGAPAVLLAVIVYLTWRVGRQNSYWEARVQAVTGELSASYETQRQLEAERVAGAERERIYQDLHDDIGARPLSMVYRAKHPEDANAARQTLRELRAIVARSGSGETSIQELFAEWQHEAESRAGEAGLDIECEQLCKVDTQLGNEIAFHLTRMVRELISNVITHAVATRMELQMTCTADRLTLRIVDDGRGFEMQTSRTQGAGIVGLERRAAKIGANIQWQSDSAGCRVTIEYHLNRG
ncbi:MAG: hypothetical protein NXH95_15130 [Pseudomonadaceae bacterium]|nr:hypothetical protein [Pseudomonadaceae bacterium]